MAGVKNYETNSLIVPDNKTDTIHCDESELSLCGAKKEKILKS